jgi:hypothetical protein
VPNGQKVRLVRRVDEVEPKAAAHVHLEPEHDMGES